MGNPPGLFPQYWLRGGTLRDHGAQGGLRYQDVGTCAVPPGQGVGRIPSNLRGDSQETRGRLDPRSKRARSSQVAVWPHVQPQASGRADLGSQRAS
ncbi:hypothetical protein H8959_007065 [Pygathrix nigripes]